ncbi:ATP-dependent protease [Coniochaeta hoffmannii]|uniref:ATP-dependent protease n=1 Tax=Coniochaeta hoffmannii TaxID=91930 RepID=A0AA38R8T0_9PEZI|nr:ATP-dependent protease [Coniochaeta hoffmannii]
MSSTRADGAVATSSIPHRDTVDAGSGSVSNDDAVRVPVDEQQPLTPEQIRDVVRLLQCPRCSFPLRQPVTLPCGKTVCRLCLPEPYVRTNVSYPAVEARSQGFHCPFPDCEKEHAVSDCGANVALNKVVPAVRAEYGKGRVAAVASSLSTIVVVKDQWQATGVPSLQDKESVSWPLPGGRLLATYLLAELGELDYNAEVAYLSPDSADHADLDAAILAQVKEVTRAEMDCQVCYALYYDSVTTPCGHTYCRVCLQRVLDHARHCPICRRPLSIQPLIYRESCPENELIRRLTTYFWADMLEDRRQAVLAEARSHQADECDTPLFICTLSFPSMPTFLHVFEPRYRLMIRRAMERDRTFGMVLYDHPGFVELGTLLRIVNVEFFEDGRSLLETVGVSRFRILRHAVVDGYTVAKVETINDISIAEEEQLEAAEIQRAPRPGPSAGGDNANQLSDAAVPRFPTTRAEIETTPTQVLMDFATDFVRRMQQQSVGWLTARILAIYGQCPNDPALFPWWFASILPVREMEKYRLLETTSVRERLKICCSWIMEWEASRW